MFAAKNTTVTLAFHTHWYFSAILLTDVSKQGVNSFINVLYMFYIVHHACIYQGIWFFPTVNQCSTHATVVCVARNEGTACRLFIFFFFFFWFKVWLWWSDCLFSLKVLFCIASLEKSTSHAYLQYQALQILWENDTLQESERSTTVLYSIKDAVYR